MEEGRVRLDGSDWVYEYQLKDHLGNVRITFGDLNDDGILNPSTEIQDANDYYPFGLRMAGENTLAASPGNEYLYNGKELQVVDPIKGTNSGWGGMIMGRGCMIGKPLFLLPQTP